MIGWVLYDELADETPEQTKLRHVEQCRVALASEGKTPGQATHYSKTEHWDDASGRWVDIALTVFE